MSSAEHKLTDVEILEEQLETARRAVQVVIPAPTPAADKAAEVELLRTKLAEAMAGDRTRLAAGLATEASEKATSLALSQETAAIELAEKRGKETAAFQARLEASDKALTEHFSWMNIRMDKQDEKQEAILAQAKETNGRLKVVEGWKQVKESQDVEAEKNAASKLTWKQNVRTAAITLAGTLIVFELSNDHIIRTVFGL